MSILTLGYLQYPFTVEIYTVPLINLKCIECTERSKSIRVNIKAV